MEALYLGDLAKLALTTFTGAAIGFERESHGQATGLRTNILVCIGSCLMMRLSLRVETLVHSWGVTDSVVRLDPGMIVAHNGRRPLNRSGIYRSGSLYHPFQSVLSLRRSQDKSASTAYRIYRTYNHLHLRVQPIDRIRKILSNHAHITIHFINYVNNLKNGTTTHRLRISHREPVKFEDIIGKLNDVECIDEIRWEENDIP